MGGIEKKILPCTVRTTERTIKGTCENHLVLYSPSSRKDFTKCAVWHQNKAFLTTTKPFYFHICIFYQDAWTSFLFVFHSLRLIPKVPSMSNGLVAITWFSILYLIVVRTKSCRLLPMVCCTYKLHQWFFLKN